MKALLYKDFVTLWKNLRMYLLMCVIFQLASLAGDDFEFMRLYPLILVASLPHSLVAYDERSKWEQLALTMPVSRRKIVSAKYLMGLLLLGAMFVLAALTSLVRELRAGYFDVFGYWFELSMNLLLGLAVMCVALPATFRMGSEKGRLINTAAFGILAATLVVVVLLGQKLGLTEITLDEWIMVPVLAMLVLMLPISWFLSVRWYEKREF